MIIKVLLTAQTHRLWQNTSPTIYLLRSVFLPVISWLVLDGGFWNLWSGKMLAVPLLVIQEHCLLCLKRCV